MPDNAPKWEETQPLDVPRFEDTQPLDVPSFDQTNDPTVKDEIRAAIPEIVTQIRNAIVAPPQMGAEFTQAQMQATPGYTAPPAAPAVEIPMNIGGYNLTSELQPGSVETLQKAEEPEAAKNLASFQEGVKDTVTFAAAVGNAVVGTALPFNWENAKAQWQRVSELGDKAPLEEISNALGAAMLVYGGYEGLKAVPGLYNLAKNSNVVRKLRIPERGLAEIPDEQMYRIYQTAPDEVKREMATYNPQVRSILLNPEKVSRFSTQEQRPVRPPTMPQAAAGDIVPAVQSALPAEAPVALPRPSPMASAPADIQALSARLDQPIPKFEETQPAPRRLTQNDLQDAEIAQRTEAAAQGLKERPTAPVEGWKQEAVPGGGTSLESPSGYRVFVPEGQDPQRAAAAIREIERAQGEESQIPEAPIPVTESPLPEAPVEAPQKQPWEMTEEEFHPRYVKFLNETVALPSDNGHTWLPARYLRFGRPPQEGGASRNHFTGKDEKGVSIYKAWFDPKTGKYVLETPGGGFETQDSLVDSAGRGKKRLYEVSGEGTVETGADGEDLLKSGSVKIIKEVPIDDVVTYSDPWLTLSGKELPKDQTPNWSKEKGVDFLDRRKSVKQALSEGKPVPPEVLKDYPDLAAPPSSSTPVKTAPAKAPLTPIEEAPAPDWTAVDAVADPFRKYSWLEKIANSNKAEVTDTALSGVLDRLEQIEPKVGSNAWHVAWAVAQNPSASPDTKSRALALRENWMRPGREYPEAHPIPEPPAPVEPPTPPVEPPAAPPAPPATPPAASGTPPTPEGRAAKLRKALAEAGPIRAEQDLMYSEERAKRFEAASQMYAVNGGGFKGFHAALAQLKGPLEKKVFESLAKALTPEDADELVRDIFRSPELKTEGDRISAAKGFQTLFEGGLPQPAQIDKLHRVFGKELVDEIQRKRPFLKKAYDMGLQVANIPRSIMASMDMSAPFRQGLFFVTRPQFYGKSWGNMFKSAWSESDFEAFQKAIEEDPDYPLLKEAGLDITGMATVNEREERFATPLVERALRVFGVNINVPGRLIRASGRAYVGFLNKLRLDVAKALMDSAQKAGYKPTRDLIEKIVKYVNTGTGRGGLGAFQGAADVLNATFFSPRLAASRVNLLTKVMQPSFYEKQNAFIRRQYWRDMFGLVALGNAVLGVAYLAGADVGMDPRSADFGKIKIGNTRLDVWGGFQQYARMAGQLISGEYVSSITGKVATLGEGYKPLTRWDILWRQVESKEAPVASFITAMLKQQDWEGKPVSVRKEIAERAKPLALSDLYEVATTNPKMLPVSALGVFGFGSQTYGAPSNVNYKKMATTMSFKDIAKTLEITTDKTARTQLFQAAIKKFPGAVRKATDKEAVKKIRADMVKEYRRRP